MKDSEEQIEVLKGVSEEIEEMLETLEDCAKSAPEMEKLVREVKGADMKKVAKAIAKGRVDILASLAKARDALLTNEHLLFGKTLGTILYQLFLADKLIFAE
eukprot:TRINITY_DN1675_c0_g1_i3.p2 TRINITY_DN1675_c0_g1~~TRINITY_DN1675_c0_g1_i3.p2  ORF type:complete len:102 (+),score=36.36 TRINITY_DN1675_c0_g1_i3:145-450(+)